MDEIIRTLQSVNVDPKVFITATMIMTIGSLILGCIGKLFFKKRTGFSHAVSASIGILFVYAAVIVVYSALPNLKEYMPPLPYVTFDGNRLIIFSFSGAHYTVLCKQILSMVILAALSDILDSWIPDGKRVWTWFLSKCINIVGAIVLQILINRLFAHFLPYDFMRYAPAILLGLLLLMLLLGVSKLIVGLFISSVHPLIGAFYTFFFATALGKAIFRAFLSTAILTGLAYALSHIGCTVISIASAALIAYIPLLVTMGLMWYFVNHKL